MSSAVQSVVAVFRRLLSFHRGTWFFVVFVIVLPCLLLVAAFLNSDGGLNCETLVVDLLRELL